MSAINQAHAPSANLLEDAVAAERLANELTRGRHFGKMLSQQVGAVNAGNVCMIAVVYSQRSENKIIVERRTSGAKESA
jgi:hypothetical protein